MTDDQETDTQTQTQTQNSQLAWNGCSSNTHIPTIWGRLYFRSKSNCWKTEFKCPEYIDLTNDEFKLGRSLQCDYPMKRCFITDDVLKNISKQHFTLRRDLKEKLSPTFIYDDSYNGTFVNGVRVGRGKRRLLDDSDEISITHPAVKLFVFKDLLSNEQSRVSDEISNKYYISRTLGQGACGIVKLVYHKRTGVKYAMKIIEKPTLTTVKPNSLNDPQKIRNEINILKSVTHPCIVRTEEVIESERAVCIVMELLEGGELFDAVTKRGRLPEYNAKIIIRQVLYAVIHLHKLGITHRDIKLENVLLESPSLESVVKVTDFGLSKCVGEEGFMKTMCGTPLYIAPELLTGSKYSHAVDVWSLGVVLFVCLSGYMPFSCDYGTSLREQIVSGRYRYSTKHWSGVSLAAKLLVRRMLTVDPRKRITVQGVLNHKWMQDPVVINRVDQLLLQSAQIASLSQLSVESNDIENKAPQMTSKRPLSTDQGDSPVNKKYRLGLVRSTPEHSATDTTSEGSVNLSNKESKH